MTPLARYVKSHSNSDNSTNYTPVFTDLSGHGSPLGSVGSWTPNWFGVHNPSTSGQSVTIWTVEQGTSGSGAAVYLPAGSTFYAALSKINVGTSASVTLLGTANTAGLV